MRELTCPRCGHPAHSTPCTCVESVAYAFTTGVPDFPGDKGCFTYSPSTGHPVCACSVITRQERSRIRRMKATNERASR